MYTLKVKDGRKWRKSMHTYTLEQAQARMQELTALRIECKLVKVKEK